MPLLRRTLVCCIEGRKDSPEGSLPLEIFRNGSYIIIG
jgi:hypothetical protein